MNSESLNFENTEIGQDVMLIDQAPGDLIYEVDSSFGKTNKMLGKVERIGFTDNRYEIFVKVYDSTNPDQIGKTLHLFHQRGLSHYGPKLRAVKIKQTLAGI
jgi:hypothetical protein